MLLQGMRLSQRFHKRHLFASNILALPTEPAHIRHLHDIRPPASNFNKQESAPIPQSPTDSLARPPMTPQPNSEKKNRGLMYSFIGVSVVGLILWSKSNSKKQKLPLSAQKVWKEAIWQESDKMEFNYKKALRRYIEALDECDRSHVDLLSDDYTRIELKIAEMYEKLNMLEEAQNLYQELLSRFFEALNVSGKIDDSERGEVLRKDLRILIKSLEINKDIESGKKRLLQHLLLAQEEILSKSPELKEFFENRKKKLSMIKDINRDPNDDFKTFVSEENIKFDDQGYMILDLEKNSSAWEPFKEEFFTARDLYTAYCLSSKDIAAALSCKITSVEWMVMADMPPGQILLSQANLGSLFYLQAEKLEADLNQLEREKSKESDQELDMGTYIKAVRFVRKNRDLCLERAQKCYDSVINFAKRNRKIRFHVKDQLDPSVAQSIALSTYGMGVLSLHEGVLAKAEKLFKDSITMAKETEFNELLAEAEKELEKTTVLKAARKENLN
ncbi:Mgr3p [Saccharomyces paradoxus]|uniref:Mgr3p n=1 Tax=Saccharomyces paradoxus TaxID=27291 RepID=A0A8B8UXG5_SACPA|nr:Mgr3 [Saccharomyces paradoxus]QHS75386.1 Mgr3 [Saccharomyces paradoxus]